MTADPAPAARLAPGFAEPATDSADAFRAALDALARPGKITALPAITPPDGLSQAAAVLLLTLADPDTPVWLDAEAAPALDWLVFHTGAPVTPGRTEAMLAVGRWNALMPLTDWPMGEADYPDRSATLIAEVPALESGPALALSGPGIDGNRVAAPVLPATAPAALADNRAAFPLGVDLFLAAGNRIMGLPRTTRVTAMEAA